MESEIGEVHLRQHEDQREQEKLKVQQDPTPQLHTEANLSYPATHVNKSLLIKL
jgi:hypothetical protein